MMTSLPRFRSDLELRRQSTPDGTMVLVDDTVSGEAIVAIVRWLPLPLQVGR
jgi:hypothetical protein